MKKEKSTMVILLTILYAHFGFGQNNFSDCSAAFLNSKMIVNEYSPSGKCTVSIHEKGNLTVNTVKLSSIKTKITDAIMFQVAIKDKETGTLILVSKEQIKKVAIESILSKCKKGDHIVLLTINRKYSLPHNEILVL
jgi:hypothetical protein